MGVIRKNSSVKPRIDDLHFPQTVGFEVRSSLASQALRHIGYHAAEFVGIFDARTVRRESEMDITAEETYLKAGHSVLAAARKRRLESKELTQRQHPAYLQPSFANMEPIQCIGHRNICV